MSTKMKVSVTCATFRVGDGSYSLQLTFHGIPTQEKLNEFAAKVEEAVTNLGTIVEPWQEEKKQ